MPKIERIVIHWTAGTKVPNHEDLELYNFVIDGNGKVHNGKYTPEDNISASDGKYAAHVGGMNSGSIGVAVCGMMGYVSPKKPGKYLINRKQIEAMCDLISKLNIKYGLDVTEETNITHYEVGIKYGPKGGLLEQNAGKVDITYLPYDKTIREKDVPHYLRSKIKWYMVKNAK